MANHYNAGDIQVLEGLDAVRVRPGMYIGSTGARGLHHILWEIVDNGMDEVANGYGDTIRVTLHTDGSATVEDNGRGIPVDIHPQMKVSGRRSRVHPTSRGRQVRQQQLFAFGRTSRRWRVGNQRAFPLAQRRSLQKRHDVRHEFRVCRTRRKSSRRNGKISSYGHES